MDIFNVILNLLVYVIPIISLIYFIVGIKLFKQNAENKVNYFSFLMFASSIYSLGYFLELNCISLKTFTVIRDFEFLGSVFIPAFGILFISEITRIKVPGLIKGLLFIISFSLWLLFITDPIHHLIYKSIDLKLVKGFGMVDAVRGDAFFSLMMYYIAFLIFSSFALITAYDRSNRSKYKNGLRFLFISLQLPWITILLMQLRLDKYIDLTPPSIMVICILIGVNEIRNDMFELQVSRWFSTYSNIGEPSFLVDKTEILCLNSNANSLLSELDEDIKEMIGKLDSAVQNKKAVAFSIKSEDRWFEVKKNNFDVKNKYINYLLVDITDRIHAEKALKESEEKYRLLITQMQQGIAVYEVILDDNGKPVDCLCLDANEGFERLTGLRRENIIGKTLLEIHPEMESFWIEKYSYVALTGETFKYENHCIVPGKYFEEVAYHTQYMQFAIIISDITERKRLETVLSNEKEEILYLSYHDQLTGLFNRRFYEEELIRLNTVSHLPLTIVMGDVNGLKLINDSFGHAMGDELLKRAAEVITKGCRTDDVIARVGGDEFVILLSKTDAAEAEKIIRRIKDISKNERVGGIDVSISFGFETKTNDDENIHNIYKHAEDHMYRHKLYDSLSMKNKIIDIIMNTLYEKNNREMLHSRRVSEICKLIAINMDFDNDAINQMKTAGLIHDIGKMGIDEKILNKPGCLSSDEFAEIKKHPEIGYRILSSANEFSEIAEYVLKHHERWDGTGYPRGLKGEEISLQARIIAVADAYDAMTVDRPYRNGLSEDEAVNEIIRCSSTQFDPNIARVLVEKVLRKEWT